jgi:hypothetical protein
MARSITFRVLVLFACSTSLLLSGCMSRRASNNLGYAVTQSIFGRMMDIPYWTDRFREGKGRVPRDFAELRRFVSRQTDARVQLEPYARVDFAVLASGQRQAECYSDAGQKSVMIWGKPGQ